MSFSWLRFWQPDLTWLNDANMTNYRSLNAMRLAVAIGAVWAIAFLGSVFMFWRSVWVAHTLREATVVSAVLLSGKEAANFASTIFEGMLWFAGAMGSFAVGGAIGKRMTDTRHRVEVEKAKKHPVVVQQGGTSPQQEVNIQTEQGDADVQQRE